MQLGYGQRNVFLGGVRGVEGGEERDGRAD